MIINSELLTPHKIGHSVIPIPIQTFITVLVQHDFNIHVSCGVLDGQQENERPTWMKFLGSKKQEKL